MSFLEIFNTKYADKLNARSKKLDIFPNHYQRRDGFSLVFKLLEETNKKEFKIIETGVIRKLGAWKDGQSTILFQDFLKFHNGNLHGVDIDPASCNLARQILDEKICKISCNDSVNFLSQINKDNVDLYHLDSYDVNFKDDFLSAEHHLREFKTIEPFLKNCLVLIDDNTYFEEKRSGKGSAIVSYLASKKIFPIHDAYQILYKF